MVASTRRARRRRIRRMQDDTCGGVPVPDNTPLYDLCPMQHAPRMAFVSLMLREVLAFNRQEATHSRCLHDILECRSLRTHKLQPFLDPDHFTPIRHANRGQQLMLASLQSSDYRLTSEYGLSNMLVRFGTGQGLKTEEFMTSHLHRWFTSYTECLEVFEHARQSNQGCPKKEKIKFSNGQCWGQPCWQLSLDDVKKRTDTTKTPRCFRERFEPMFAASLLKTWKTHLGEAVFDKDLSDVSIQDLPSYETTQKMIEGIGIQGFGSKSITSMQLANFMALVGLCRLPSVETMGSLTWKNGKGALNGLVNLGFDVRNAGERDVIRAFKCVYDYLDHYLSAGDKETLGFGAIFVEHLLCKVIRWSNLLTHANLREQVDKMLADIAAGHDWRGEHYPLPLHVDRLQLQTWHLEVRERT
ncbi:hypothetical protein BDZ89DRAFT_986805 [Hymenopellis radicata]|nr:hypothetical protein BDZ89DRAFT_986805 [Hymenopellis radicata]